MGKYWTPTPRIDQAGFPMSYGRYIRSVKRYGRISQILDNAIKDGYIQKDLSPERPENILIYRLANADGSEPEGWYSENRECIADELATNRKCFYAFCTAMWDAKRKAMKMYKLKA